MKRLASPITALGLLAATPAHAWLVQKAVSVPTATTQVILGGGNADLSAAANRYLPLAYHGAVAISATDFFVFPVSGTITGFKFALEAPVTTGSYAVAIYINGSATSAACTADAANQICDWTGSVAVSAGDTAMVVADPSAGPAPDVVSRPAYSTVFQPATPNDTVIQGGVINGTFVNSSASAIVPISSGSTALASARRQWRLPDGGTVDDLYAVSTDPAVATSSYDYTVMQNGSASAVTVNIAAGSTTGNDTTHSASVTAGDDIAFQATPTNSPTASQAVFGVRYVPDTAEAYVLGGSRTTNDSTTATEYYAVSAGAAITGSTTEAEVQEVSHAQTIKAMYCRVSVAPGSGKSRTFTLRINGVDTAATCTLADSDTDKEVTGLNVAVNANDKLSLSDAPSGTPAATTLGRDIPGDAMKPAFTPEVTLGHVVQAMVVLFAALGGYVALRDDASAAGERAVRDLAALNNRVVVLETNRDFDRRFQDETRKDLAEILKQVTDLRLQLSNKQDRNRQGGAPP